MMTSVQLAALSPAALQLYRQQQASTVRVPYIFFACVLIAFAIVLAMLRLPEQTAATRQHTRDVHEGESMAAIFSHPQLVLAAIAIFTYVGAEVSIGSFLVNYFHEPAIANFDARTAAGFVTFYWMGAMIGRFVGSGILQKVRTGMLLGICALMACALVITSILTAGHLAMWTILAVGLFNSIMFPSIFTLGIEGLGPLTGRGSGLLVMAIVGGAIIPPIEGRVADAIGIHHAFFIPAICYVYIAIFGFTRLRAGTVSSTIEAVKG
jgi:FHS family L-fucose permease-like MFS transporter